MHPKHPENCRIPNPHSPRKHHTSVGKSLNFHAGCGYPKGDRASQVDPIFPWIRAKNPCEAHMEREATTSGSTPNRAVPIV